MTLPVIDPKQPFQPEYQSAIADLVRFWRAGAGPGTAQYLSLRQRGA